MIEHGERYVAFESRRPDGRGDIADLSFIDHNRPGALTGGAGIAIENHAPDQALRTGFSNFQQRVTADIVNRSVELAITLQAAFERVFRACHLVAV